MHIRSYNSELFRTLDHLTGESTCGVEFRTCFLIKLSGTCSKRETANKWPDL